MELNRPSGSWLSSSVTTFMNPGFGSLEPAFVNHGSVVPMNVELKIADCFHIQEFLHTDLG